MFADAKVVFSQGVHLCSLAPFGPQAEAHFLPDDSAEKSPDRMSLPSGGVHKVLECRAPRFLQQSQNLGRTDSSRLPALVCRLLGFVALLRRLLVPNGLGFWPGFGDGFSPGFASRHREYFPFLLFRRISERDRHVWGRWGTVYQFVVVAHSGFHLSLSPGLNASHK